MTDEIILHDPVNLKFMPAQVDIVLKALGEIPYRMAQPVIESILNQCREQVNGNATQP